MTNHPDHDVNALVDLATEHPDKWGDSCHHAMAQEIVRLRNKLSAAPDLLAALKINHVSSENGADCVKGCHGCEARDIAIAKAEGK